MNPGETIAVFGIAITLFMSILFFILLSRVKPDMTRLLPCPLMVLFLARKTTGFLLFGVIPAGALTVFLKEDVSDYGLLWGNMPALWLWVAGISVVLIALNVFNSRNAAIRDLYPELRLSSWKLGTLLLSISGWTLYLAGYEFMFRGLLLFACYKAFGLWPAIIINLALYSVLHLHKGQKEAIAAIPFGAVLCYLSIESGSIFPAIILHIIQAVSCEIACLTRNPQMNFSIKQPIP